MISLAGIAMMNASRITPSSPSSQAAGSSQLAACVIKLASPTLILPNSQISAPAGGRDDAGPGQHEDRAVEDRAINHT